MPTSRGRVAPGLAGPLALKGLLGIGPKIGRAVQFREMMKQKVLVLVLVPVLAVVGLISAALFTGSEDRRQEIADAPLDEFANLATNYMGFSQQH